MGDNVIDPDDVRDVLDELDALAHDAHLAEAAAASSGDATAADVHAASGGAFETAAQLVSEMLES